MSGPATPRLLPLGDAAWTVEFGAGIAPEVHARVMALAGAVAAMAEPAVSRVASVNQTGVIFDEFLTCISTTPENCGILYKSS